jgi:alpha-L-fucosidase
MSGIQKNPWQTDTSIGDWFYNKNWKYRGADWVIHTLVDAVSKNGNLLINVVQRPDGSLDPEAEKVLSDMADWMKVNSESIYATSPWISYGEGPTKAQGGAFKEDFAFSAKDVRFSSKGNSVLYATLMGKPESDDLLLKSLPKEDNTPVRIESVRLLGSQALVSWKWTSQGLAIHLPKAQYSDIASVVKITGTHLRDFPVAVPSLVMVSPDSNGVLTLSADKAELHGEGINTETRDDQANLGFWDSSADWASWHLYFKSPGRYSVVASVATQDFPTSLRISLQGESLIGSIPKTAGWGNFETIDLGTLEVKTSGLADLALKPSDPKTWKPMNLRSIVLKPIP